MSSSSRNDGDVCWFKCRGYPVWPGLKVPEARLPRHIKKVSDNEKVPFIYYGSKPVSWGFASSNDVMDFENNKEKYVKLGKQCPNKYKVDLANAIAEAETEINKTKEERFKIIPVNEDDQSSNDETGEEVVDDDEDDNDESEVNSLTDRSNDHGELDVELYKILDTKIVTSLSQFSDDEYNSNKDDERNRNTSKKRKKKEMSNKSRSKSNPDTLDFQYNQKLKKPKVEKNIGNKVKAKDKPLSTNICDITKLKSTNIPVWQQLQQQQQQQQQKQSNSSEHSLSQSKVDDDKVKRLTSRVNLLDQLKVNESMNASRCICIINDLEKDIYTYDELRLSKAAEFITNLRQSSNVNIATAASKLRNIWKSQCQKESSCDQKIISNKTNKNFIANVEKKTFVSQIDNILGLKNSSNEGLNQLNKTKVPCAVSVNDTNYNKPVLEDAKAVLDAWNVDNLSPEVKNNVYRCRSIRLIHDSVKRISIATQLEELCFKKYWNYIPNSVTPPGCYLEHIRFVTFNILEQHQYYLLQQCQIMHNVPNSLLEMLTKSYHT